MKRLKRCGKCKKKKELSSFSKLRKAKDGRNYYCRLCQRSANRECWAKYYKRERSNLLRKQAEKQKKRAQFISSLKSRPCIDCKKKFPPYVMDFDHIRGRKKFILGKCGNLKWARVLAEIKKCEIVCANCHRIRTHKRKMT